MDVQIVVITGGGRKANRESKSYTIKEVVTMTQVTDALSEKFKEYFTNQATLDEVTPVKSKKNVKV